VSAPTRAFLTTVLGSVLTLHQNNNALNTNPPIVSHDPKTHHVRPFSKKRLKKAFCCAMGEWIPFDIDIPIARRTTGNIQIAGQGRPQSPGDSRQQKKNLSFFFVRRPHHREFEGGTKSQENEERINRVSTLYTVCVPCLLALEHLRALSSSGDRYQPRNLQETGGAWGNGGCAHLPRGGAAVRRGGPKKAVERGGRRPSLARRWIRLRTRTTVSG
jgi:hypothetical protein